MSSCDRQEPYQFYLLTSCGDGSRKRTENQATGHRETRNLDKLTSHWKRRQFCFKLDAFMVGKPDKTVGKRLSLRKRGKLVAVDTLLRMEKKFSAKALSQQLSHLDME